MRRRRDAIEIHCQAPAQFSIKLPVLWPVSRRSRKVLVAPENAYEQNLKPLYDYKAVLFIYSYYEQRFPSYKKFQAYWPLFF